MYEGTLHDVRLSTHNTYLQTFHYRIVKRIISTNTFLFRLGKSESPLCTFCKSSNETLYHILWNCEKVKLFLKEIIKYFKDSYNVTLQFVASSWFFPRVAVESYLNILIVTIIKLTIFKYKYKNQLPSVSFFYTLLRIEAEKEEMSARNEKSREKFMSKWGNVTRILSNTTPTRSLAVSTQSSIYPSPVQSCCRFRADQASRL